MMIVGKKRLMAMLYINIYYIYAIIITFSSIFVFVTLLYAALLLQMTLY